MSDAKIETMVMITGREYEALRAEVEKLRAEVEKLRAALEPFANMGKAMMGRKHHNEAVVQYELAPTIKVFHLVAAHETRAATPQEPTAFEMFPPDDEYNWGDT